MTIEFTNATPPKGQSGLSIALLVLSCLFFFIPASLVVLGYYSSLPTGTLISPIPQGIMSNSVPNLQTNSQPIIAAPEEPTQNNSASANSNATQKTALISANSSEAVISDPDVTENSQIYLINREDDKSLYNIKSKSAGIFTINVNSVSASNRELDYQIVNQ